MLTLFYFTILLWLHTSGQEVPADKQINIVWSFPNCSRDVSRKVVTFLEKEVYPILPTPANQLPSTCPLHPLRNLFQDHEKHKVKVDSDDWKCTYCNKRFVNEFYLDKHLHSVHPEFMKTPNDTYAPVCMADLCPIFGCRSKTLSHHLTSIHEHKKRHYDDLDSASAHSSREVFQNLGEKCSDGKVQYMKELCESVADACFAQERARYSFVQRVCSKLACARGMLSGAMKPVDASPSTDFKARNILYRVVKYMCVVIVLIVGCFQLSMIDASWVPYMLGKGSSSAKDKDLLSMYAQKQRRQQNWMSRWWHSVFREQKNK
eukprot:gene27131-32775_t